MNIKLFSFCSQTFLDIACIFFPSECEIDITNALHKYGAISTLAINQNFNYTISPFAFILLPSFRTWSVSFFFLFFLGRAIAKSIFQKKKKRILWLVQALRFFTCCNINIVMLYSQRYITKSQRKQVFIYHANGGL